MNTKEQVNGVDARLVNQVVDAIERRRAAQAAPARAQRQQAPSNQQPAAAERQTEEEREPRERPVKTFSHGDVVTRIWVTKTELGEFIWRVDQRRCRTDGWGGPTCKTLQPQHLGDAIRGFYEASRWIKKTERRLRWRRLWF